MERYTESFDSTLPQLYGLKAVGDKVTTDDLGIPIIHTKISTVIYLFGYLVESLNVTFTRKRGNFSDDCSSMWLSGAVQSTRVEDGVGRVEVSLEEPDDYFICLFNQGITSNLSNVANKAIWLHQGSSPHITLRAVNKIMPIWIQLLLILLLLTMSGLFSGLNLGLMALDQNELKVISRCGTDSEKRYAKTIAPVRARGNYLLCSLLFGNVLVNSSLTILMDDLTSGLIAIFVSTLSIVIFGEIIPQAICSRHGLAVGAKTITLTYIFMVLTIPLSWPISKLLDFILGDEIGNVYDRERLMEYIKVTKTYNKLEEDEVNIISGALCLKTKTAGEVMTRLEDAFMLPITAVLDFNTVSEISKKGYSRIPIYDTERKNIVSLLHAKDLAFVDPDDKKPLRTVIEFYKHPLIHTYADETLNNVLNHFKHGKSHMAFVRQIYDTGDEDPFYEISGLVTLEDVIEEILQMEIVDETDILTDNRKKQKRKEAQVRQDFSEFAKIGEGEMGNHVISPQMGLATFQYLATAIEPFSRKYITENVLRRLIGQKIYFCAEPIEHEESINMDFNSNSSGPTFLYEFGKPVDYFIMILEGRVNVVVGNERLIYEAGPFTYFGVSALRPPELLSKLKRSESVIVPPSVTTTNTSSRPPSPENMPLLAEHRKSLDQQVSQPQLSSRPSSPDLSSLLRSPSSNSELIALTQPQYNTTMSDTNAQSLNSMLPSAVSSQDHTFIPDFTVQVLETTIYMKIPRKVYLAAFRASLLDRRDEFVDGELDQFREEVDSLIYNQLASKSSVSFAPSTASLSNRMKKSSSEIIRDKKFSVPSMSPKFTLPPSGAEMSLSGNLVIGANASKRKTSLFSTATSAASPKLLRRNTRDSITAEPLTGRPVSCGGGLPGNGNVKSESVVLNIGKSDSSSDKQAKKG